MRSAPGVGRTRHSKLGATDRRPALLVNLGASFLAFSWLSLQGVSRFDPVPTGIAEALLRYPLQVYFVMICYEKGPCIV